jgi:hypothetical protein
MILPPARDPEVFDFNETSHLREISAVPWQAAPLGEAAKQRGARSR